MKYQNILFAMILIAIFAITPVSAVDYTYWENHYVYYSGGWQVGAGVPPNGYLHIYNDSEIIQTPTLNAMAIELGGAGAANQWPSSKFYTSGGADAGSISYAMPSLDRDIDYFVINPIDYSAYGIDYAATHQHFYDGYLIVCFVPVDVVDNHQQYGPNYIYHAMETTPISANYSYSPAEPWMVPEEVQFTDESTGPIPDWLHWDISIQGASGTIYSAVGSPELASQINYTFALANTYVVNLTVTNGTVSDTESKTFTVYNPEDLFTLTLTPDEINLNANTTAEISAPLGDYSNVNYYVMYCYLQDSAISGIEVKYEDNEPIFRNNGTFWHQIDDITHAFDHEYGATFPESIVLEGWDSPGDYECEATLFATDGYPIPRMYANITVLGEADQFKTVTVNVKDSSGSSYVYGATASIKRADGTWNNKTVTTGPVTFQVTDKEWIGYTANATGYTDPGILYTQITADKTIDIILPKPFPEAEAGYASLQIYVKISSGGSWVGLSGASVYISDGQIQTTPSSGLVSFNLTANSSFTATASKTGYTSVTVPVTCGATTCGGYTIVLDPVTTTVVTTTAIIPTVSGTLPSGRTDYSGFWGPLAEGLEGAGADASELGILLAAFLVFIGFCIGGWSGSAFDPGAPFNGMGSLAGGIFGFVLSVAFGFIPLLWLVSIILISAFVFVFFKKS